jgi:CheY-like chemotaxis protein
VLRAETVDIAQVISGFDAFLRRALGEAVAFEVAFDPGLWRCRIDPLQFETSILNLVVNARDAMPGGGTLKIAARNVESDEMKPEHAAELAPGAYVCVSVADSGTGMPEEVEQHAFEPFFTTKEVGKGSGLGLSQVYGFAKQSGGHVVIGSAPGRGTVISLYLPRSDAPLERHPAAAAVDATRGGQESILVVEDDDEVRELAVTMMRELGYHVLVSRDGLRALEVIRSDRPIDLLFSDVVMPGGISGAELAREAQTLRCGLKVLLTSGYPRTPGPHGGLPIIAKPWSRGELARRLRLALDGEDDSAR